MRTSKTLLFLLIFTHCLGSFAFAQVAVIPYKIDSPSARLPHTAGSEYARLLSTTLLIVKKTEVVSPRDIGFDLKRLSLDPQEVISEDDLLLLGKSADMDSVLIGTLSYRRREFFSDSVLYSLKARKVIVRNRTRARSLFELARKDINRIFPHLKSRQAAVAATAAKLDAVLCIDLSYNIVPDWAGLRRGIDRFLEAATGQWNVDTRVTVIPFNNAFSATRQYAALSSPTGLRQALDRLKPAGGNSERNLNAALSFAVRNISWRANATKTLLIVTNTPVGEGQLLSDWIVAARRRGISTHTITLGNVSAGAAERIRTLASMGRGNHYAVTYRQRLFNAQGKEMIFLFESGRLFRSFEFDGWEDGLFGRGNHGRRSRKASAALDEIFFDEKKVKITPYTMATKVGSVTDFTIINSRQLQNNISTIFERIGESVVSGRRQAASSRTAGKVLLSDGRLTVWVRVANERDLDFFRDKARGGFYFTVGVSVQKRSDEPYGFTFNPMRLFTTIPDDYVPDLARTDLAKIIKNPDAFVSQGLLSPPVWFIKVKAEDVELDKKGRDVRD